jgi:hypothetical protein
MEPATVPPFFGTAKESSCFPTTARNSSRYGPSPRMRSTLITARVGLDGVGAAFDALANPDEQCKILVTP